VAVALQKLQAAIAQGASVLLDTSPLIAYLEGGQTISPVAAVLIDDWIRNGRNTGVVSVVSVTELLLGPKRAGRGEAELLDFLKNFPNLTCAEIGFEIADAAAALRATTSLRTPDALILATSQHVRVGAVATNDGQWKKQCPGLPIVTLSDYQSG
jgi:predicted nucleic acid-binding protein